MGERHWSDPKRTRAALRIRGTHLGYIATVGYPNRDLTAFPEGSPYFEVVVADLGDRHVALFQRYKAHWLIHCGSRYAIADAGIDLTPDQIESLALFALEHQHEGPEWLLASLNSRMLELAGAERGPT